MPPNLEDWAQSCENDVQCFSDLFHRVCQINYHLAANLGANLAAICRLGYDEEKDLQSRFRIVLVQDVAVEGYGGCHYFECYFEVQYFECQDSGHAFDGVHYFFRKGLEKDTDEQ